MEREEERVKVDEIDLRFCLLRMLFKLSPCGYVKVMGTYKVEKRNENIQKMTILGAELIITYSNLFINHQQDMAKFVIPLIIITMSIKDGMKIGRICL
jgi:hypothetical protein